MNKPNVIRAAQDLEKALDRLVLCGQIDVTTQLYSEVSVARSVLADALKEPSVYVVLSKRELSAMAKKLDRPENCLVLEAPVTEDANGRLQLSSIEAVSSVLSLKERSEMYGITPPA